MRGIYTITGSNITVANAAVTLVFLNPGTTCSLEILRVDVSQAANATSAQQRLDFITKVAAFPTLTSVTPKKTSLIDQASQIIGGTAGAAGTCGINASAQGAGTETILKSDSFNVLNGYLWVATPAEVFKLNAGAASGFGIQFPAAPASLTGWNFTVVFGEV
jgi:hypothetical protein